MAIEYCNITSDLLDVYSNLNEFRRFTPVSGFLSTTTANVYELHRSGYIEMLFENGVPMVAEADNTTPSAEGKWSYFPALDKIMVRFTGDKSPNVITVEKGLDWKTFLSRMRNDAQEFIEDRLKHVFVIPFQKIVDPFSSYNNRDYDAPLRRAVAELTVANILDHFSPGNELALQLKRRVDFDVNIQDVGGAIASIKAGKGFIQRALSGEITLRMQKTARQIGGWDVVEKAGITAGVYLLLNGKYSGVDKQVWRVEIDTSGAPGTATYKLRRKDTGSFDETLRSTRESSDNRRVYLGFGVYGEFLTKDPAEYAVGDYWDIYLYPMTDKITSGVAGTVKAKFA